MEMFDEKKIKKENVPEKLSVEEEKILNKYAELKEIDTNLEEEMEKLKQEIEMVQKTISPDLSNPLKSAINSYLRAKQAEAADDELPDYIQRAIEGRKEQTDK
jgi:hypothetical protein